MMILMKAIQGVGSPHGVKRLKQFKKNITVEHLLQQYNTHTYSYSTTLSDHSKISKRISSVTENFRDNTQYSV